MQRSRVKNPWSRVHNQRESQADQHCSHLSNFHYFLPLSLSWMIFPLKILKAFLFIFCPKNYGKREVLIFVKVMGILDGWMKRKRTRENFFSVVYIVLLLTFITSFRKYFNSWCMSMSDHLNIELLFCLFKRCFKCFFLHTKVMLKTKMSHVWWFRQVAKKCLNGVSASI